MPTIKPMLAATPETLTTLAYPVLASAKYDGIRCLVIDGVPFSRSLKPIPNRHITKVIKAANLPELDGELIVKGSFQDVTSAVMSEDGEPEFEYHVFDTFVDPKAAFRVRIAAVRRFVKESGVKWLKAVEHVTIRTAEQLVEYERVTVEEQGFEGIMIRSLDGPYKYGRSSVREGWLMKVKRWTTEEATIVGYEEQETNLNAAFKDELGRTKRSSAKDGKRKTGVLGSFKLKNDQWGEFDCGSGYDAKERAEFWAAREQMIGKTLTYKYVKAGVKDKPRFPIFVGIRDPRDMS